MTAAKARVAEMAEQRAKRKQSAAELAANQGKVGAINAHYLCAELAKRIEDKDVIFAEAARNSPAIQQQIPRPLPGTVTRVGGGGLGSSGGMALGAKLAAPDRMMIQIVGDGSFYFNVPSSVFGASKQYKLPILSIVVDNGGWSAVKESTLRVYPDGDAKVEDEFAAEPAERRRLLQDRRGVRRLWREGHRSGQGARRARPRHQGSEGRPQRVAACDGDAAVGATGRGARRVLENISATTNWVRTTPSPFCHS